MDISQLNILAIFVAAASSFVIGGVWYSPIGFGKRWMAEAGLTEESIAEVDMKKVFGLAFLASLVIAFNLAMFLGPSSTFGSGVFYGFITGFGWVAMAFAINDLFERRSLALYAINAGYHIVTFTLVGGIVGAWH
ncbi:DUF1761 domain-containing protein [Reinekea marina]|uniref:DUF1761 domain-containing protein n=1 Tax=Reinekea marina TaxID=1310421 RepID=A0ABV7WVX1_9GAMM|nr:DUF1761 domain-containing protein [Reinekea marina]MBU2864340.1 DUF1761 domain-containing protein [Reinekea forsetii]MDN3647492.1 DUF1761 domain-containing protein [Reinekea marina]